MIMIENATAVFFPRSVDAPVDKKQQVILASELIRALEMYARQSQTKVNHLDEGADRVGTENLSLILELLNDYRLNGLYSRRQKIRTVNSGTPNWKATISQDASIHRPGSSPVYLDYRGTRRRHYADSEVSRIHAGIIRGIDERYSWILSGKTGRIAPELETVQRVKKDVRYHASVLRKELSSVYSDRDIWLVSQLIAFLEKETGDSESLKLAGLTQFHFAWEHMLSRTLEYAFPINKILPAPTYKKDNGGFEDAFASSMRTDIALKHPEKNMVAIADAKYYSAQSVRTAPGWHDLVKQFFYEKAFKAVAPEVSVKNAVIFPGTGGPFASIHMKSKLDGSLYDIEFPSISCFYINPSELVHHFVYGKKLSALTQELFGVDIAAIESVRID
ncbi:LlaJI family restriction endonuclease [Pseudomonadales bacterium]|nr:LlaJI family restriction endonuclease [Pseudomonadales bacterium]